MADLLAASRVVFTAWDIAVYGGMTFATGLLVFATWRVSGHRWWLPGLVGSAFMLAVSIGLFPHLGTVWYVPALSALGVFCFALMPVIEKVHEDDERYLASLSSREFQEECDRRDLAAEQEERDAANASYDMDDRRSRSQKSAAVDRALRRRHGR